VNLPRALLGANQAGVLDDRPSSIRPNGPLTSPSSSAHFFLGDSVRPDHRWYRPAVPKSPILPLAAAVTAVTLGASPALASPLSPGKHNEAKAVAFPLLAVKGQAPASVGAHVSHSSHVSGSGPGHASHVSHVSHVSSVPAPPPPPVATTPPPSPAPSSSPAPAVSAAPGGSPAVAPQQSSLTGSPSGGESGSPAASNGGGCAFLIVAPFGALRSGIRWLRRRGRAR
jgi:hypothetical protein